MMPRLLAISFVTAMAVGAFEVGLALRGKQILGMDAFRIGMMFAECTLAIFVAQTIVFSPLVKPEATRWLFSPGLVVLAMGLVVTPFTAGFAATAIAVGLVAASAGILSPIAAYWISLGGGATQGEEIGRQTAVTSLGQVVGSAVGGVLFGVVIVPGASFTLTAGVVLAGAVASVGLPRLLVTPQRTDNGAAAIADKRAARTDSSFHPMLDGPGWVDRDHPLADPGHHELRINSCDVDQFVWIKDPESSVVELDDAILSQIPQHPVYMDKGQARCIPDMFLGQRKMHFFDMTSRPLRAVADEQLEQQVSDALTRRMASYAGQTIKCQAAIPRDQPRKPEADFGLLIDNRPQSLVRNRAHDRIRQGLRAICHHRATARMEAEHRAWQCEV